MNSIKKLFIVFAVLFGLFVAFSCVKAGTYFISLNYQGEPETLIQGSHFMGIQTFLDQREEESKNLIGTRIIGKDQKELFLSRAGSVADLVTLAFEEFAVKRGFKAQGISGWDFTPEGMKIAGKGLKYVVGGSIEKLRCDATKRVGRTNMVLEVKITTYVGNLETGIVKKHPIEIKLTRTDPTFGASSLEKFTNEALTKIITDTIGHLN